MAIITNLGYLCVAALGGVLIIKGGVTVGVVASFLTYTRAFTMPMNNIAGTFNNLQSALAGAERVFEVLAERDEPADPPDAVPMTSPRGDVRFENVRFAYTPGTDILKDVSFDANAGRRVALVGETGAGKTTVANLISRFYDATGGAVYIDGVNIQKYRRDDLRRAFSVVLQDTCLFTGTIADNIRYGRPEATDEEVYEAARVGGAYEFIVRLKDGFDTVVSGDNETLSQGQRQLLSISRAVLCKAPILILDEATSSVDTRTERRIQAAMQRLQSGATSFVIAHRLSTIRDADVIFVMKDGEIIERGAHDELIALGGEYAKMYESV
jgi:ATP-binding cassette subfamily B protein